MKGSSISHSKVYLDDPVTSKGGHGVAAEDETTWSEHISDFCSFFSLGSFGMTDKELRMQKMKEEVPPQHC
jgi:hypothetical protein